MLRRLSWFKNHLYITDPDFLTSVDPNGGKEWQVERIPRIRYSIGEFILNGRAINKGEASDGELGNVSTADKLSEGLFLNKLRRGQAEVLVADVD